MAKKVTTSSKSVEAPKASVVSKAAAPTKVATAVRNTSIPPKPAAKKEVAITHDLIAKRAFEIYASGKGGSESDNWHRAERELRGL